MERRSTHVQGRDPLAANAEGEQEIAPRRFLQALGRVRQCVLPHRLRVRATPSGHKLGTLFPFPSWLAGPSQLVDVWSTGRCSAASKPATTPDHPSEPRTVAPQRTLWYMPHNPCVICAGLSVSVEPRPCREFLWQCLSDLPCDGRQRRLPPMDSCVPHQMAPTLVPWIPHVWYGG